MIWEIGNFFIDKLGTMCHTKNDSLRNQRVYFKRNYCYMSFKYVCTLDRGRIGKRKNLQKS